MPFITFQEFRSNFPTMTLVKNEEEFVGINTSVSRFISDRAGIETPEFAENAPDWVKTPALFLAFRFAALSASNKSPEFISDSQQLYAQALLIIDEHKVAPKSKIITGVIEEKFVW